ncbi:MAG TPA: NAD-dependent deacylase [Gemmatimonadales bacterium]|nr:NAD-dependent deacylase [Gemmatimonadales bacterium]
MSASLPTELTARLRQARHVAVLTGAGVSAESGVPTFRDAQTGLWARYRAEDLATPEAFARDPELVWAWYRMRAELVRNAEPNPAHIALARLETLVPRLTLLTQNVDGLHARAGSRTIVELHGNILRARCTGDGMLVPYEQLGGDTVPRCTGCGALLRPDVVWFGEPLPRAALETAFAAARECDVFLSVGTSNVVEPAASLPWIAAAAGAAVAVINPSLQGQRSGANIFHLAGKAGEHLPALLGQAWA